MTIRTPTRLNIGIRAITSCRNNLKVKYTVVVMVMVVMVMVVMVVVMVVMVAI